MKPAIRFPQLCQSSSIIFPSSIVIVDRSSEGTQHTLMAKLNSMPKYGVWEKPSENEVKLNADGAISGVNKSYGGLLRNCNGGVLFAYSGWYESSSVITQELKAIQIGLEKCNIEGYKKVWVASDSLRAVCILKRVEEEPWYCRNIVAAIRKLMVGFESVRISHVYRELNQAADALAKLADSSLVEPMFFCLPLNSDLSRIVTDDANQKVYVRL